MLKKMENKVGGQEASLLDTIGDEETSRQRPIVLHLTLLTFIELVKDGEKFGRDSQGTPGFFAVHHG